MLYFFQKNKKKEFAILSAIYLMSQWFLLVVSGRWWDDWCFFNQPAWALEQMAMQLGRPTVMLITKISKLLPESGYRILTFIFFYYCMLFVYRFLKTWVKCDDRDAFWISALYATIPVSDARIVYAVFPYSIGVFFMMAGLVYFSKSLLCRNFEIKERILALSLFLISFILNSNLCYYAIVLLIIVIYEKSIKRLYRYLDFILLPFAYYFVKSSFFPTYGLYAGYNSLTLRKILKAVSLVLPADGSVLYNCVSNWVKYGKEYSLALFVFGLLILTCIEIKSIYKGNKKKCSVGQADYIEQQQSKKVFFYLVLFGFVSLSLGVFPYIAIRQRVKLETIGLSGRDAILALLGASILLYSVVTMTLKKGLQNVVLICMVFSGILFFNKQYLAYQEDWYRQLGFQHQLSQHYELSQAKNIVYLNDDNCEINIQHFYQLNGNAEEVFGRQDKFIMGGFKDVEYLYDDSLPYFVSSGNYHMLDYDTSYKDIDAIVEYSMDIGLKDSLMMRVFEITDDCRFNDLIASRSAMNVYMNGTKEYNEIMNQNGYEVDNIKDSA